MSPESASRPLSQLRPLMILMGVWAVLTGLRFFFYHEINGKLWIGSYLIDGLLWLIAFVVIVMGIVSVKQAQHRIVSVAVVALVAGLTALLWISPVGSLAGIYSRMWRSESAYQEIVDKLAMDPSAEIPRNARIDAGPPLRVAFSWGGIIDNWHGIVHDPSGEVRKASQFKKDWSNWGDPELSNVKRLFGGDMRSARHLWGDWYYCSFT